MPFFARLYFGGGPAMDGSKRFMSGRSKTLERRSKEREPIPICNGLASLASRTDARRLWRRVNSGIRLQLPW